VNELDVNRMLLLIEKSVREINREEINPIIPELNLEDLHPTIKLVAQARARYLKQLMDIASLADTDSVPSQQQIKKLKELEDTYYTLVNASKAIETAIERGYLDIKVE